MAVTLLQSSTEQTGSGSVALSLTGVTAGSTIVVVLFQTAQGTRTYSATDYTAAIASTGSARQAIILYRESVASGSHSITVNANLGTVAVVARAFEFSPCTFSVADVVIEGVNNTDHDCASSGLDVAGDALIVSGGVLNGNGGTLGVTSGATRIDSGSTTYLMQYEVSGSGFTVELSTWTSSTSRAGINVSAGFVAAGGGGPTYTITGGIGSFTLTGIVAGLLRGRTLTASTASFTLTGIGASLIAARAVTATPQSFTLASVDAGLLASRVIAGTSESFALTGVDANLDYSGSLGPTHTLAATSASFALTGIDAGTIASRVVSATTATFALTGQDAQALASRYVACSTESFVLTGVAASLLASRIIAASSESFVLDGKAAQLNYSGQTGSYIIQYYYHLGA